MNRNDLIARIMRDIVVEKGTQFTKSGGSEYYVFYVMSSDSAKSTKFEFSVKYPEMYSAIVENIKSRFPYLHSLLLQLFTETKQYTWPDGLVEELVTGDVDAGKFICFIRDLAHSN
jgi:hypothetical protein